MASRVFSLEIVSVLNEKHAGPADDCQGNELAMVASHIIHFAHAIIDLVVT